MNSKVTVLNLNIGLQYTLAAVADRCAHVIKKISLDVSSELIAVGLSLFS